MLKIASMTLVTGFVGISANSEAFPYDFDTYRSYGADGYGTIPLGTVLPKTKI